MVHYCPHENGKQIYNNFWLFSILKAYTYPFELNASGKKSVSRACSVDFTYNLIIFLLQTQY